MPMSSLKTLIKFMFKSHEVNFEKIFALFSKSSMDAKVCILEHFYLRTVEEPNVKEMFLKLLGSVCDKNPDIFQKFFEEQYQTAENLALNQEVLNTVRSIIETEKMSIYMLNFAGFLNMQYNIPFERAMGSFSEISLQEKTCTFALVYMLRNYKQQQGEINKLICAKLAEYEQLVVKQVPLQKTVLYLACNEAICNCKQHQIVSEAADLYIDLLCYYDMKNESPFIVSNMDLDLLNSN